MKVIKIIWDVIRYILGSILVLSSLILLTQAKFLLAAVFLFITGILIMPFIYRLLRKTKIPRGLIIALAIVLPIIFFIVALAVTPDSTDSTTNKNPEIIEQKKKKDKPKKEKTENSKQIKKNASTIKDILGKYIAGGNKEKEIEVKYNIEAKKYEAIIHYSLYKDDGIEDVGSDVSYYLRELKKAEYYEDVDPRIIKYTFYFYINHKLQYAVEYNNNYEDSLTDFVITNVDNSETRTYTSNDYDAYRNALREKFEKEEAERKAKEEEEKRKKEQEKRRKDSSVIHNVGETVICPYFEITLNSFQIKKEGTRIDSYTRISDPEWIGAILTVKNIGNDTHTFLSTYARLQNSTGEIIDHSFWNYNIWGAEMLNSPTLIAGGTKTGYVSFANTNQDDSNLILLISCNDKLLDKDKEYKFSLK